MRNEVSRAPANNPNEMTVILKTNHYRIDKRTGNKEIISTEFTGPYYPDFLEDWIMRVTERSGQVYVGYEIMDVKSVRKTALNNGLIQRPYDRWLVTYDDGSTGFAYTIPKRG
ncbi:hypothetical protein [Vibrio phage BONAISHI]|nr:hypothetical protein [Vibrio phage BONAISHI]